MKTCRDAKKKKKKNTGKQFFKIITYKQHFLSWTVRLENYAVTRKAEYSQVLPAMSIPKTAHMKSQSLYV